MAQLQSVQLTDEQLRSFDPMGNCEQNGRSIDLHRVMLLENRWIDIDSPQGPLRISVNRGTFLATEIGPRSERRQFISDISDTIDPGSQIDIELKLAYLDGRLVLYWKETFQNRRYRQGLFNIVGTEVASLCEGLGGRYAVR